MITTIIEAVFGAALFINALLFIPQIIKIIKEKSSRGVSLITFVGFLLIQLSAVLYGLVKQDMVLVLGYLISIVTCGAVVILALIYKSRVTEEAELSLEDIIEQLPVHAYWKDTKSIWRACSGLQAKTLGFASNKDVGLIGKTNHDLYPKEDADRLEANDQEVMKTGETKVIEELCSNAEGKERLYLSHKTPLRNKQGKVIGTLGVSVDITRAKQKLEDRLALLEHIISLMPGHVYWKNKEGVLLGCNDNQAKSAGLNSRKEILGKTDLDMPWREQASALRKLDKKVMETGIEQIIEEHGILANGVDTTFLSSKVPLYSRGEVVGVLGISFDITERKRLAELQMQKDIDDKNKKVMNLLSGSVAHELRTPLAIININLDLLTRVNKNEDLQREERVRRIEKYSEAIRQCIRDTTQVINMILIKMRHVVSNKVEDKAFKEYSISDTIEEALNMYPYKVNEEKLVEFERTEQDFKYRGDLILTRHVIFNLVKNGLAAIQESGFGDIKISLNLQHDKNYNRVIVLDTAGGISQEKISKIFSKFESPDNSQNGAGLGLSFCKLVMESYDGDVLCDSDEETYTRFSLIFPK